MQQTHITVQHINASYTQTHARQTLGRFSQNVLMATTNLCCITISCTACVLGFCAPQSHKYLCFINLARVKTVQNAKRVLRRGPESNLVHQFSVDPAFMEVLFKLTPVYTE